MGRSGRSCNLKDSAFGGHPSDETRHLEPATGVCMSTGAVFHQDCPGDPDHPLQRLPSARHYLHATKGEVIVIHKQGTHLRGNSPTRLARKRTHRDGSHPPDFTSVDRERVQSEIRDEHGPIGTPETRAGERLESPGSFNRHKDLAHRSVSLGRELVWTVGGLIITAVASTLLLVDLIALMRRSLWHSPGTFSLQLLFTAIFLFLIYGNTLYQIARLGYLVRLRKHKRADRAALERVHDEPEPPAVCMLVPSYKEEVAVVRQSLLSCVLQEWPRRRVVLLIDDPHHPRNERDRDALERMRELPAAVAEVLTEPAEWCRSLVARLDSEEARGVCDRGQRATAVIELLHRIAAWCDEQADREPLATHGDRLFVALTFRERARIERDRVIRLQADLARASVSEIDTLLLRERRRLARLFEVEVTSFERRHYVNLSHEPNKAMNLNSYIGLMGGSYQETYISGSVALEPAASAEAVLHIPDADFLLTLDADSLLDSEYALRLLHVMRAPGNERMAVIQTPYSAVPDAPGVLERVAGATTDMQYIIHQGFTGCRATFWVGANALLRREALEDIVTTEEERGFVVRRYIQDRTVIEDTESSIDLIDRGWSLHNYPERMSYSATPPDFGSLVIQRQRWANGGLIILPKLLRYLFFRRPNWVLFPEAFMRLHYLTSIAAVNVGVLLILTYPFDRSLQIRWLPLTALPYYVLYGRDLWLAGYRAADLFRVYALNLVLIPVNIAGVLKSIEQLVRQTKIPFSRTPKIEGHTPAPTMLVACEFLLLGYCLSGMVVNLAIGSWLNAAFSGINACILYYAMDRFMGVSECARQVLRSARDQNVLVRRLVALGLIKRSAEYEIS